MSKEHVLLGLWLELRPMERDQRRGHFGIIQVISEQLFERRRYTTQLALNHDP